MAAIARAPRNVFNLNPYLVGTVVASWALTIVFAAGGNAHIVSHDALLDAGAIPALGSLLLFLAAWQVMTAAMMLPSSMPMIGLFAHVSGRQQRPRLALAVFLAAYFVVWSGFAVVALMSDAGLHRLVESWAWLDRHDYLIPGVVFVLAGAFQFSSLKERCLDACRSPVGFLFRYYQRGPKAAWNLGIRHGLFCLGCCWALMLIMFAVGVGSLIGMAALTGIMVIEKTNRHGRRLASIVGIALLIWGGLVLMQPNWLPATLASSNQTNEHQHEQAPADLHLQQHDQLPAQPQVPHH
jgi:predicted metal-binding membrane protein